MTTSSKTPLSTMINSIIYDDHLLVYSSFLRKLTMKYTEDSLQINVNFKLTTLCQRAIADSNATLAASYQCS